MINTISATSWENLKNKYTPTQNSHPTSVCPSCGYCPHCGRGGYHTYPYPYYPPYPYNPWYGEPYRITWTSTGIDPNHADTYVSNL